jgi:uncharacterized protein YaaR (DUF327 family)
MVNKQRRGRQGHRKSKILKNKDFISLLARTKNKKKQKELIRFASNEQIHSVLEIILNLRRLTLTEKLKKKLRRYKSAFRQLLKTKSIAKQKRILVQSGSGFLGMLLPPLISSVLGNIVK